MIDIFISHPTPCNKYQIGLLKLIDDKLEQFQMKPVNLGRNNFNSQKPLEPIKKLITGCKGAIIIGLERHHSYIGYEKENSDKPSDNKEHIHKYTSTPWVQIEAGMAYQAGLSLLILKESKLFSEGILDPNNSGFYVFEFDIKKNWKQMSSDLNKMLESWIKEILDMTPIRKIRF